MGRLRNITLEHVVMFGLVVAGLAIAAAPIGDNSLLVHIRTGAEIVAARSIPTTDIYSFTASGEPWIVQSWLPEVVYGLLGGGHLVIALHCMLSAATVLVMVVLARGGTMIRTLVAGGIPVLVAFLSWTPRPLLFALLCFSLVIYVAVRRRSVWWLLPIVWLWVNSHGSWPIGIAWLSAFAIGERIDRGLFDKRTWRCCAVFMAGVVLGAINPLGPRLLGFFTTVVGERSDVFSRIAEWQSPDFHSATGIALALALIAAVAVCFNNKVPWSLALPALGLLAASLYSTRHVAMFAIAVAPLLGAALRTAPRSHDDDGRIAMVAVTVLGVVAAAVFIRPMTGPAHDFDDYPIVALDELRAERQLSGDTRIAARETTGCYLVWRDGRDANVFVDDRFDMYPARVLDDYATLLAADDEPRRVLDRNRIDYVVWEDESALSQLLRSDAGWREMITADGWAVFERA